MKIARSLEAPENRLRLWILLSQSFLFTRFQEPKRPCSHKGSSLASDPALWTFSGDQARSLHEATSLCRRYWWQFTVCQKVRMPWWSLSREQPAAQSIHSSRCVRQLYLRVQVPYKRIVVAPHRYSQIASSECRTVPLVSWGLCSSCRRFSLAMILLVRCRSLYLSILIGWHRKRGFGVLV